MNSGKNIYRRMSLARAIRITNKKTVKAILLNNVSYSENMETSINGKIKFVAPVSHP